MEHTQGWNKSFQDLSRHGRLIAVAIAAVMFLAGAAKLFGVPFEAQKFSEWHYPLWFMYLIGNLEIAAAAMLFTRFALFGAILVSFVMAGGVATHIVNGEPIAAVVPLIVLIMDWAIGKELFPRKLDNDQS